MAKLKSFIENYLKNQKISDYEGWLALYGKDAEGAYRKERAEADNAYASARAEHGSRASALYEKGLSGSGYSDFLNHAAYAKRQSSFDAAQKKQTATQEENRKGYLSYLNGIAEEAAAEEEKKKTEEDKIFSDLLDQRLLDEGSAINYLTSRGVSDERAAALAEESLSILRGSEKYISEVISKATSAKMNYHSAYKYAIAKGLTEDVARNVATVASFYVSQRQSNLYRYY